MLISCLHNFMNLLSNLCEYQDTAYNLRSCHCILHYTSAFCLAFIFICTDDESHPSPVQFLLWLWSPGSQDSQRDILLENCDH